MRAVGRSLLALLAGLVVAALLIGAIEMVSVVVYQVPTDPEAVKAALPNLPLGAFLMVLVAHAAGTAAGAVVTALLAGRAPLRHGVLFGVVQLAAGVGNLCSVEHPLWFAVVDVLVF